MDVKIVKLVTGEELLTQVEEENDVTLVKPMILIMQQSGLQMVPFLMLAKMESLTLKRENILFSYEPKDELVNAYRQRVGSIVTAPANALDNKGKLVL